MRRARGFWHRRSCWQGSSAPRSGPLRGVTAPAELALRQPPPRLGLFLEGCRPRVVELRVVDSRRPAGQRTHDVDEAPAPGEFARFVGVASVDGLVEGLIEAGERDEEKRSRAAQGLLRSE